MTIEYIDEEKIAADLASAGKPVAYGAQEGFPFNLLTDRQFECLLHDLARSLLHKRDRQFGNFDAAILMQGVGERGRDCALIRAGRHVGAIQCKRFQGRVSKPEAAREIIKFCLHALLDADLLPNPADFKYIFATSTGFTEPANVLLSGFSQLIGKEAELQAWTREVALEFKAFAKTDLNAIQPKLLALLESLDVLPISFNELNTLLVGRADIIQKYFSVRMVVDDSQIASLFEKVDGLTRTLGDKDTRRLLDSLSAIPRERRADYGLFSLWGYPEQFLKGLASREEFRRVGAALTEAKNEVDRIFAEHMTARAQEELLATPGVVGCFSSITLSAATPYVVGQLLMRWTQNQQGNAMAQVMAKYGFRSDALSVRSHALKLGDAYLKNDWSDYVKDSQFALRKEIARHTYGQYADLSEMTRVFDHEWPQLEPLLRALLIRLEADVRNSPTKAVLA